MPSVKLPLPFEAYTGDEPFIFVSYAHTDGEKVFPELERLHKLGYRIWYDEGIDPGNEWPEEIPRAISRTAFFLVFISARAIDSTNVRNEINFALNKRKPFLAVHLEETELPAGLELRMGDIQAVLRWRMSDEVYYRKMDKVLPQAVIAPLKSPIVQPVEGLSKSGPDIESIKIGEQEWMVKNLHVDHYCNGDAIPQVTDPKEWGNLRSGARCYYDNDTANGKKFGKLYNWFAVNDPRGLAPSSWHVPSDEEWQKLIDYLGGDQVAGGKLKEAEMVYWREPNTGADNKSRFSALLGGYRGYDGYFYSMGYSAYFWSSTEYDGGLAWGRDLLYYVSGVYRGSDVKRYGFSVRCVRDLTI